MNAIIEAKNLSKHYGSFKAVDDVSFNIGLGRIVGLIGSNGAGKTTLLNAILGLTRYKGELSVLGQDPSQDRAKLMEKVCFISDVATLPRWMKVSQTIDFVEGVHPAFSREKALDYISRTQIPLNKKIKGLSKGMVTQLHLALVMSIDAQLLVLDEPTLGLDIIFRKRFYENLLEDYFDHERTILVTTHQVEEIENILTDVMFIRDGKIVLNSSVDDLTTRFHQITVEDDVVEAAKALNPIWQKSAMGMNNFVFDSVPQEKLAEIGSPKQVGLADLFVAKMSNGKIYGAKISKDSTGANS